MTLTVSVREADDRLRELLRLAAEHRMTPREAWLQRVSFAYGNAALSNPAITRADVEREATKLYGPCPAAEQEAGAQ